MFSFTKWTLVLRLQFAHLKTSLQFAFLCVLGHLCGKEIGPLVVEVFAHSFIFKQHSHADWGHVKKEKGKGYFYENILYEIFIRWAASEITQNTGRRTSGGILWVKKKKRSRGEKASRGRNDGVLSDLNCGVKGCDGSVNSTTSHILCLCLRVLGEFSRHRSRLTLTAERRKCMYPYIAYSLHR